MTSITIIICTFNRANVLLGTLISYSELTFPENIQVDLLLVDNKSSDSTRDICEKFISDFSGDVQYIFEPTQGLSTARNRGIQAAKGEIIAFVDDDVFFHTNWLKELAEAFASNPNVAAFGGKSVPIFEGGAPLWMENRFLPIYGDTQLGNSPKWIEYPKHPFGLNMAFKRYVFQRVGDFKVCLGRKKNNLLSNEESDLFQRISAAGLKVYYSPEAIIYHRIPKDRLNKEWVLLRYFWQGASDAKMTQITKIDSNLSLLIESIRNFKKVIYIARRGKWSPRRIYWGYHELTFSDRANLHYQFGKAVQYFRLAIHI